VWRGQDAYTSKPSTADPLMFGTCPTELQGVFFLGVQHGQATALRERKVNMVAPAP